MARLIYVSAPWDFRKYTPPISEAAPYICRFLELGRSDEATQYLILNVPCLCYFEKYLGQVAETVEENERFSDNTHRLIDVNRNPQYKNVESNKIINRVKIRKCVSCRVNNRCNGIWEMYLEHYGDKEIKPVR